MPFRGQDAWRSHPKYQNLLRNPLPGFRPAVVVFGIYLGAEYIYKSTTTPKRVPRTTPLPPMGSDDHHVHH